MTKSFNVERNYRISNDDPYLKARFSQEVVPDENETTEDAALRAIKQLDNIFRMAYPYVAEHLNFHVVRDYSNNLANSNEWTKVPNSIEVNSPLQKVKVNGIEYPAAVTEKINKGTIEEQIQASKTLEELDEWKLLAKSTPKLKGVFNKRENELINEAVK